MGFDTHTIKYLLAAQAGGVSFERVATIGRQALTLNARELRSVFEFFGERLSAGDAKAILEEADGYADELFRRLGAASVDSVDASEYESATIIHDLNQPIPDDLRDRFTLLIDGGSLEHVFNVPVALRNCMEMVAIGGHYVSVNPANNFFGHGFYQFSPELFFRAFSPENGYEVDRIIAFETRPRSTWYLVRDPREVHRRVRLENRRPVHLIAQARRIVPAAIFAQTPQQFKYSDLWSDGDRKPPKRTPRGVFAHLHAAWKRETNRLIQATVKPRFNPKVFARVAPEPLRQGRFESRADGVQPASASAPSNASSSGATSQT